MAMNRYKVIQKRSQGGNLAGGEILMIPLIPMTHCLCYHAAGQIVEIWTQFIDYWFQLNTLFRHMYQ